MDRRMLDMGGEAARRQLFSRINSNRISGSDEVQVAQQQELNAEEAKVQVDGDIGQGNRLTDAKKAA
jgi:hypothetical protein